MDVGAYDGDTIREFLLAEKSQGKHYSKIIAIEPEPSSFEKLNNYISSNRLENVTIYDNCCWDEDSMLHLNLNEESSSIDDSGMELEVRRIDTQFQDERITLVKINYLHGVVETLKGAEAVLKNSKPNLAIIVGFDEWGLIKIPQIIKKINPSYKLGLRFASPMPARLILFGY